ncbi:MAG: cytochrome c-type biogenesis protein CcmH [Oceanospirillaceae bacterium]|nr:cytochrome c-type biogenesis protein CcmH [Oceanospirillaceae bacterium]
MRRFLVSVCFCITTAMCALAQADITSYEFAEPEMAQRFVGLTTVLRCPKCQNQNLSDSDSIIAKDLRTQIQTLINSGNTDQQITDFMVQRYGDFILYDPPFNKSTLVLWLTPVGMIFIGLFALWFFSRKSQSQSAMLTTDEQQKLHQLLANNQLRDRD